jgi:tRNA (guanine37-N1)-methyltransferase
MHKKRIWIMTMFPEYFEPLKQFGVLGSALRNERGDGSGEFELITVSISDFNPKGFKGVDDSPFGGGVGMIMRADILKQALIEGVVNQGAYNLDKIKEELHIVCPSPRGKVWCHKEAIEFSKKLDFKNKKDIVFICGRYEGIDERFLETYVDEYISLGDYILTGGELATMTILDSAMRFAPGVLGNKMSAVDESFASGGLEYALYTRPREFEGVSVPDELLSGSHAKIEKFKKESSLKITKKYRPDLLEVD